MKSLKQGKGEYVLFDKDCAFCPLFLELYGCLWSAPKLSELELSPLWQGFCSWVYLKRTSEKPWLWAGIVLASLPQVKSSALLETRANRLAYEFTQLFVRSRLCRIIAAYYYYSSSFL
jgi:hypothetical protein